MKNASAARAKNRKKFSKTSIPTGVWLSGVLRASRQPRKKTSPKRSLLQTLLIAPLCVSLYPHYHIFYFPFSNFPRLHRVAPFPQPAYPLSSHGGLGCVSARQSGSSLESSSRPFFAPRQTHSNSTKNFSPKCAGAASAPSAEAAPSPSPASRTSRMFSTWPPSTVESGRPRTSATPGIRFSMISPPAPSALPPLPHPTRILFTPAAAKDCSARTSLPATGSINPPTPVKPGRTRKTFATPSRSPRYLSIRKIQTASSSPPKAIPTAPTPNAAFFVPLMAARLLPKFCTKTKTPAPPILPLIHQTHKPSTLFSGLHVSPPGKSAAANHLSAPAADFSNPPTAETPGTRSPRAFPQPTTASAASALLSRRATQIVSTPRWKQKRMARVSTVPTTPANPGNW